MRLFACAIAISQNPTLLYPDDPTWTRDSRTQRSHLKCAEKTA
jgi:ABC-type dipeptide/oligopeptide/nickel transport system ATPase component